MGDFRWKDQIWEHPRRYKLQQNADGTVDIIPEKGQSIQEGTPVNAQNLNRTIDEIVTQAEPSKIPRALENGKLDLSWLPDNVDIQIFTESGTWVKPYGAKMLMIDIISGGGGGASGSADSDTNVYGGYGGGGGGRLIKIIPANHFAEQETVIVGAGGAGGIGVKGDNNNSGTRGGASSFADIKVAGAQGGGLYSAGDGGGFAELYTLNSLDGRGIGLFPAEKHKAAEFGGAGGGGFGGGSSLFGGSGGGAGGKKGTTSDTGMGYEGGISGKYTDGGNNTHDNNDGADGQDGDLYICGSGGQGARTTGQYSYKAGNGGVPGGGGGGGAGMKTSWAGGDGGNGGRGEVRVYAW